MTHDTKTTEDGDLAVFFDAARHDPAMPSGDFMARLQAEALAQQPPIAPRRRRAAWREAFTALGGWPTIAGLTAATCAGIWIGVSPPDTVLALLQDQSVLQSVDPLSGFDYAMLEG